MSQERSRRERGTVAVVVAMSATMIFALCALGVDLGSAFARKRDIQTQADLATLAAAAKLPYSASNEAAIEQAATDYATSNEVAGQDTTTWNFGDADQANGYIEYVGANKLRLFAPRSNVDFWLAPVAGLPDGMNVSAVAAAEIKSPGKGLPFFISTTCGWGQQTILDQTSGGPVPPGYTPVLVPATNATSSTVTIATLDPSSSAVTNDTTQMLITANGNGQPMNGVNLVGFTTETGAHLTEPVTGAGTSVSVTIPPAVLSAEAVWWVRLRQEQGNQQYWSEPVSFVVGDPDASVPVAECDSKNSGNFGSLDLSRTDVTQPSRYLVENMAQGIQHDLDKYPPPVPVPPSNCAGLADAETDTGTVVDDQAINCLETDTGSDLAQKATDAFIIGTADGSPPRLAADTSSVGPHRCSPLGDTNRRQFAAIDGDLGINDDVLSCFLKDDVSVGDVTGPTIANSHKFSIDKAIFKSPRFFWIPVLIADPSGGAGSHGIVDFRAVFITEQDDDAENDAPQATANNGIEMSSNGRQIEKIRVRTINPLALPEFSVDLGPDNTVEYTGAGTKIVRLVE